MRNKFRITFFIIFISMALTFTQVGCSTAKNTIEPLKLSKSQKEIVDLISDSKHAVWLFSYNTSEKYKTVDFWVETYKDGVLLNARAGGIKTISDGEQLQRATLSILTDTLPDYRWTFNLSSAQGGTASNLSELCKDYPTEELKAFMYDSISNPIKIEEGKEIILAATVFSSNEVSRAFDQQEFLTSPELLQQYLYAHIIKCKFSR